MATLKCLGSSSSGNCYILECDNEQLIIELGVSWKEVLIGLNYNIGKVVGALCSHVHADHVIPDTVYKFIKYGIPVFSCEEVSHKYKGVSTIKKGAKTKIGGFKIQPIPLKHSCECFGFVIEHDEIGKLVFATDCSEFLYRIKNVNHWLIEANYGIDVLIDNMCDNAEMRSRHEQHLELDDTINALKENYSQSLQTIVLLHLSNGNSNATMFKERVSKELGFFNVHIAEKGLFLPLQKEEF